METKALASSHSCLEKKKKKTRKLGEPEEECTQGPYLMSAGSLLYSV